MLIQIFNLFTFKHARIWMGIGCNSEWACQNLNECTNIWMGIGCNSEWACNSEWTCQNLNERARVWMGIGCNSEWTCQNLNGIRLQFWMNMQFWMSVLESEWAESEWACQHLNGNKAAKPNQHARIWISTSTGKIYLNGNRFQIWMSVPEFGYIYTQALAP